jgi:hypothetical protein
MRIVERLQALVTMPRCFFAKGRLPQVDSPRARISLLAPFQLTGSSADGRSFCRSQEMTSSALLSGGNTG